MTENQNQFKKMFNMKLVIATVITVMLLMPVFSAIHEYGHVLACELAGRESNFSVSIMGSWATCEGKFEDPTVFRYAGGLLSALIAFNLFNVLRRYPSLKFLSISLVSIGIVQFIGGTLEGFANDFYMNSGFAGAIQAMVLLTLTIFFLYRASLPAKVKEYRY